MLRRTPRKGVTKYRYTLVAQSEKLNVKSYLGGTPTFALAKPLPVKKGDVDRSDHRQLDPELRRSHRGRDQHLALQVAPRTSAHASARTSPT